MLTLVERILVLNTLIDGLLERPKTWQRFAKLFGAWWLMQGAPLIVRRIQLRLCGVNLSNHCSGAQNTGEADLRVGHGSRATASGIGHSARSDGSEFG
jgi:hypothetical protein